MLVYRHGGKFSPFIGARIAAGIVQFIANGMMMSPDAPGNVIGRERIGMLKEVFCVISQQPSKRQQMCWSFV
jgi:hypothetical protein